MHQLSVTCIIQPLQNRQKKRSILAFLHDITVNNHYRFIASVHRSFKSRISHTPNLGDLIPLCISESCFDHAVAFFHPCKYNQYCQTKCFHLFKYPSANTVSLVTLNCTHIFKPHVKSCNNTIKYN